MKDSVWLGEISSLYESVSGDEQLIQVRGRFRVRCYLYLVEAFPEFSGTLVFHRALFILVLYIACIKLGCNHLFMRPASSLRP